MRTRKRSGIAIERKAFQTPIPFQHSTAQFRPLHDREPTITIAPLNGRDRKADLRMPYHAQQIRIVRSTEQSARPQATTVVRTDLEVETFPDLDFAGLISICLRPLLRARDSLRCL